MNIIKSIISDTGANKFAIHMNDVCPHCLCSDEGVIYPRGPHLRLDCADCGRFIKFVPKADITETFIKDAYRG
jgi:uncharacterized protein (DUF983 family)